MQDESRAPGAGVLERALERALSLSAEAIRTHVESIRRRNPGATPHDVQVLLERAYLTTVTASGGVSGATAAAPGVGIPAGLTAGALDGAAFLTASTFLVLATAEVHGIPVNNVERRKALVLAVLLGDVGAKAMKQFAGRTGGHLGREFAQKVPIEAIRAANRVLGRNFVTRYGTRQGVFVLGKAAPFGIGAVIGAGGNLIFGYMVVRSLRAALGPAPESWQSPGGPTSQSPGGPTPQTPRDARSFGAGMPAAA